MAWDPKADPALVIDIGSRHIRSQIACKEEPESEISLVVRPRFQGVMVGMGQKDAYIGKCFQFGTSILLCVFGKSIAGSEAIDILTKRSYYTPKWFVEEGRVTNWDDWERAMHNACFNMARVAPEERPMTLVCSPLQGKNDFEKMVQIAFETFNAPLVSMVDSAVLALAAANRSSGLVLDAGHQRAVVTAVLDGHPLRHSVKSAPVGGGMVSRLVFHAYRQWTSSGGSQYHYQPIHMNEHVPPQRVALISAEPPSSGDGARLAVQPEAVRTWKYAYDHAPVRWNDWLTLPAPVPADKKAKPGAAVPAATAAAAADAKQTAAPAEGVERFELPSGTVLEVAKEQRVRFGDWFFRPQFNAVSGVSGPGGATPAIGMQDALVQSLASLDARTVKAARSVLVCGGSSQFPNLLPRLDAELKLAFEKTPKLSEMLSGISSNSATSESGDSKRSSQSPLELTLASSPATAAWRGGAMLSQLSTFQERCLRLREDYDEYGPSLVHRFFELSSL